jgi:NAD(P)-dependent dehydrogenase (short-subunit alcohol dehydrogenase family)
MGRVLVTGAASGIGAGTAALLAEQGWEVVGADLRPGAGQLGLDAADEGSWDRTLDAAGPGVLLPVDGGWTAC